ncbi:Bud22p [Sugiyamaella lignohabitans]|uniref:Bud22p n=1 Tax=Sugiyamaella lignohabitans TaxID=796027 RepID=A0A167FMU5_9ASCO|nr:Bud22p [Sugiyamaella lignohabitans]ANB15491.1 Bud22p [Sugiyamaella lignohabitans]
MSKENLLWKLDLLESQLKEDPTAAPTRLVKTKFAVGKEKKRTANKNMTAEEIEEQIREVKKTLVDRKIFHCKQVVQRALKKALTLEGLKIQKRIKAVKADDIKLKALNKEALAVKTFKADDLAKFIVLSTIFKLFLKNYEKHPDSAPEFLSQEVIKDAISKKAVVDKWENNQKNVYGRLCNNNLVKSGLQQMTVSVKFVAGLIDKTEAKSVLEKKSNIPQNNKSENQAGEPEKRAGNDTTGDSDAEGDFADFDDGANDHLVAGSDSESAESGDDDGEEEEEEEEHDDFFSSAAGGDLPTLATGYISGSDDDDNYDYDNDATVKAVTTERKNRRGQRARRKIWEMKYGSKANHVQKEKEERRVDYEKRQREFEERQARRAAKQATEPTKPIVKSHTTDDKPLHPSWEAKKKIVATAKFEGKKIKF